MRIGLDGEIGSEPVSEVAASFAYRHILHSEGG